MNIYFSCSITGGRQDQQVYHAIVDALIKSGHEVSTAHLSRPDVMEKETDVSPADVYNRDVRWVEECDALIAEVSTPSHGVGYEVALALSLGKPVFCCYQHGRRVSKMILGNSHPTLSLFAYNTLDELLPKIREFLLNV
jgi:2'-deoxynucleoside 5'-phosphate N-hydrolase